MDGQLVLMDIMKMIVEHVGCLIVMNMQQIAEDPHILDRGSLIELDGIKMQGLIARLSRTPGQIRWPGKVIGADNQNLPAGDECWFDDSDSG